MCICVFFSVVDNIVRWIAPSRIADTSMGPLVGRLYSIAHISSRYRREIKKPAPWRVILNSKSIDFLLHRDNRFLIFLFDYINKYDYIKNYLDINIAIILIIVIATPRLIFFRLVPGILIFSTNKKRIQEINPTKRPNILKISQGR